MEDAPQQQRHRLESIHRRVLERLIDVQSHTTSTATSAVSSDKMTAASFSPHKQQHPYHPYQQQQQHPYQQHQQQMPPPPPPPPLLPSQFQLVQKQHQQLQSLQRHRMSVKARLVYAQHVHAHQRRSTLLEYTRAEHKCFHDNLDLASRPYLRYIMMMMKKKMKRMDNNNGVHHTRKPTQQSRESLLWAPLPTNHNHHHNLAKGSSLSSTTATAADTAATNEATNDESDAHDDMVHENENENNNRDNHNNDIDISTDLHTIRLSHMIHACYRLLTGLSVRLEDQGNVLVLQVDDIDNHTSHYAHAILSTTTHYCVFLQLFYSAGGSSPPSNKTKKKTLAGLYLRLHSHTCPKPLTGLIKELFGAIHVGPESLIHKSNTIRNHNNNRPSLDADTTTSTTHHKKKKKNAKTNDIIASHAVMTTTSSKEDEEDEMSFLLHELASRGRRLYQAIHAHHYQEELMEQLSQLGKVVESSASFPTASSPPPLPPPRKAPPGSAFKNQEDNVESHEEKGKEDDDETSSHEDKEIDVVVQDAGIATTAGFQVEPSRSIRQYYVARVVHSGYELTFQLRCPEAPIISISIRWKERLQTRPASVIVTYDPSKSNQAKA